MTEVRFFRTRLVPGSWCQTTIAGEPIDNYVIEKMDTATGRWVPALKVNGDQTSAVVDGLIPGHEYKVRLLVLWYRGTLVLTPGSWSHCFHSSSASQP